jgi:hypothetical protein
MGKEEILIKLYVGEEDFNWNNGKRGNIDKIICRWGINLTTLS